MKKLLLLVLVLMPLVSMAQKDWNRGDPANMVTVWYSNHQLYSIEYSRHLGNDRQLYGIDVGYGYTFREEPIDDISSKIFVGTHGVIVTPSGWNPIWKMGIVLYDFTFYDVYVGGGIQKGLVHLTVKSHAIRQLYGEWLEVGIGLSF